MVLNFTKTLSEALENIDFTGEGYELPIYSEEKARSHLISDEIVAKYGYAKWAIVDSLNEKYGALLINKFDLYNWLGRKGFLIGIEQKGKGFNAAKINDERIKEHQGGAFTFFRECKNKVFFD